MKIRRRFCPGVGWNVFVFPGVKWNLFLVLCAFVFGPLDRSKADVTEVSDMLSSSTPPPTELDSGSEDESQPVVEGDSQPSVEDVSPHKEKEQKEALKPLGLAKHRPVWQKVEVKTSGVNVRGGFNRKFDIAPSLVYNIGKEQHAFVQLSKNHPWFLRGVGRCNTKKGDLKALAVFADIRKAYYAAEKDAAVAELAAVAESEPDDSDSEDDPMNCLDAPAPVPKAKGRPKAKAKPKGRPKRKARSLMRTFPMPKHPACSGWDPAVAGGEVDIHVYKKKLKQWTTEQAAEMLHVSICGRTTLTGCCNMRPTNCFSRASKETTRKKPRKRATPQSRACTWIGILRKKHGQQHSLMEFTLGRQSASLRSSSPKNIVRK
jgi:hypothetical protein